MTEFEDRAGEADRHSEERDPGESDAPLWAKLFLTLVPFLLVAVLLYSDSCWGGSG